MAATEARRYGLHIGGQSTAAATGKTFTTHDPASGRVVAEVALGGTEDVTRAVEVAQAAFPAWADTAPAERGRVLSRIAAGIRTRAGDLAELETTDSGKPLRQALSDVEGSARYFEFYAGLADKIGGETIPLGPDYVSYTRREPYGVIAEILPWNAPLNQAARGISPALVTGNTVVVKPALATPLTCLELAAIAIDAGLPAGVLNVVPGSGADVGEALIRHPLVQKIAFTGSVETGRAIAHVAADRMIPTSLELGGKSAHIIFEDADLAAAAASAFDAFTLNAGQICSAGTRLLVHEDVREEVVRRLVDLTRSATLGPGLTDPAIGPLISAEQLETVRSYLRIAAEEGTVIAAGGHEPDDGEGYFIEPTVLVNVTNDMRIAQEEIFGPVLCVIQFSSDDEAVAIANDSPFGLVAGLWTRDVSRAHRIASQLNVGQVFVNQYFAGGVETPFGGVKNSGYGRVKGIEAVYHYSYVKTVTVRL